MGGSTLAAQIVLRGPSLPQVGRDLFLILNPQNHHKSESLDTKISIQSVTSIQRRRIIAKDE